MKKRVKEIIEILDEQFGTDKICYLNYNQDWQLLIATILSAQCTDNRVNQVTDKLFKKYKTLKSLAYCNSSDLEQIIKPCGLYKNKTKNIILCSRTIIEDYDGILPSDISELTKLPGVGRKTANVIRGNIFDIPSVVVDTHVNRISNRLGLTKSDNPEVIEKDLMKELPKDHWIIYNIQIITFGRSICKAINPKCDTCKLTKYCTYYKELISGRK